MPFLFGADAVGAEVEIVVGQVRVAGRTARVRAVAGGAVARIQAPAERQRFLITREIGEIHGREFLVNGLVGRGRVLHLGLVLSRRRPSQRALERAETRHGNQVADTPGNRDEVQVQPPFRRRVIPLLEVAVPLVADEIVIRDVLGSLFGRPADQPDTPDDEEYG